MSRRLCCLALIALVVSSCAIQVAPQGGERDTKPPVLLRADPPDHTAGFHGNSIRLDFDEYVQLKDAASQFVVSPPLAQPPLIKARKKSILVSWDDTLREATTYTFSFGNCIVDNNEANPVADYQMVLSTGSVIDSLTVDGSVVDAYNDNPVNGALVMLYRSLPDSVPVTDLPANFSRTGSDGKFRISNVSPGKYYVLAVNDLNSNYRYDGGDERVAFTDSMIEVPVAGIRLRMFREVPESKLIRGFSIVAGKAAFAFSGPASGLRWEWITDSLYVNPYGWEWNLKQDSVTLWYRNQTADSMAIRFLQAGRIDTADFRLFKKAEKNQGISKKIIASDFATTSFVNGKQQRRMPFSVEFRVPVASIDSSRIRFSADSVPVKVPFHWDDAIHRKLSFFSEWADDRMYRVLFLPGAFTDLFGKANDSSLVEFKVRGEREYASLRFDLRQQQPGSPRLLQLVSDHGDIVREAALRQDTIVSWGFLDAGIYRVKLIDDKNENGRWDTGDLLRRVQPELVRFAPEAIPLRSNWDADLRWEEGK
ncbi:MAG: Ig-like domain-containing protein [Bacteroidota bacterium]